MSSGCSFIFAVDAAWLARGDSLRDAGIAATDGKNEENKYRDAAYGSGMNSRMIDCVEAIVGDAHAHLLAFADL